MGPVSLLDHLKSTVQIDVDSFDQEVIDNLGPFVDATSNPARSKSSMFPEVDIEQLILDFFAVNNAIRVSRSVRGNVHLMVHPRFSCSEKRSFDQAARYHRLSTLIDPSFDPDRLVVKIAATWEGLQACRKLRLKKIKTLATAVSSMEQVILAGEVGCVSVSPFIHEPKAVFDHKYKDGNPLVELCLQGQRFYDENAIDTRVKACASVGLDEILASKDVTALTILPDDLRELSETPFDPARHEITYGLSDIPTVVKTSYSPVYLDNEARFRSDFAASDDGERQYRLMQAMIMFSDFADKARIVVRERLSPTWKDANGKGMETPASTDPTPATNGIGTLPVAAEVVGIPA